MDAFSLSSVSPTRAGVLPSALHALSSTGKQFLIFSQKQKMVQIKSVLFAPLLQGFQTSMYASAWFLTMFASVLSLSVVFRIMDIFLVEVCGCACVINEGHVNIM